MWLGYSFLRINMSIGILFILIYISAIAVVLITTFLLMGTGLTSIEISRVVPLFFVPVFLLFGSTEKSYLIPFPESASSIDMSNIAYDLLVVNLNNVIGLTFYYLFVGCILLNNFHKTLHLKTSAGMRGLTLNNNIELLSFRSRTPAQARAVAEAKARPRPRY